MGKLTLSDIPQMTSKFVEIVPLVHRQGDSILPQPSDGPILEIGSRPEGHLTRYSAIQTHLSRLFHLAVDFPGLHRSRAWSQFIDPPQNFPEQVPWHRHFGHLERDVATMADDLGSDLDQLLPRHGQRPVFQFLRQGKSPFMWLQADYPTTSLLRPHYLQQQT